MPTHKAYSEIKTKNGHEKMFQNEKEKFILLPCLSSIGRSENLRLRGGFVLDISKVPLPQDGLAYFTIHRMSSLLRIGAVAFLP